MMSWAPQNMAVKDFPMAGASVAPGHVSVNDLSTMEQKRPLGTGMVNETNVHSSDRTGSRAPISAQDRVPWGWHFHPTPEELLENLGEKTGRRRRPATSESEKLREIDLSRVEPWEIRDCPESCPIRKRHRDDNSQFFYALKEQKYRHGKRNNRATREGFWKATGRDKSIYGSLARGHPRQVIGYRKALVFYQGRAPHGRKTDYILHEYRLKPNSGSSGNEEQWVVCHMFVKDRHEVPKQPQEPVEWQHESTSSDMSLKTERPYPTENVITSPLQYQLANGAESIASSYDSNLPGLVEEGHRSISRSMYDTPMPPTHVHLRRELGPLPSFKNFPSFNKLEEPEFMQTLLSDLHYYQEQPQPPVDNPALWQHM